MRVKCVIRYCEIVSLVIISLTSIGEPAVREGMPVLGLSPEEEIQKDVDKGIWPNKPDGLWIFKDGKIGRPEPDVTIWWQTDDLSHGWVEYGLDENLGSIQESKMGRPVRQNAARLKNLIQDKIYYYRIVAEDDKGNRAVSEIKRFSTDITPPTIKITNPKAGDVLKGAVTILVEAADNVGITDVTYHIGKGHEEYPGSIFEEWPKVKEPPYSFVWNTTHFSDGDYTIQVEANDIGNSARDTIWVKVDNIPPDTTPPTVRITYPQNGATVYGEVTVKAEAKDDQSGIRSVDFLIDNHEFGGALSEPYEATNRADLYKLGQHTYRARAIDKEGNVADSERITVTIVHDITPPTTTHNYLYDNIWRNEDANITLTATDDISGVKAAYYIINGGAQQTGTNISITTEGTYVIEFWSEDNAGNIENRHTITVKIDKTPPTVVIYTDPTEDIWPPDNKTVTVTVRGSATDELSGVSSKIFTVTDEYNEISPSLSDFNQTIELFASRRGDDLDGRVYTIKVDVVDNAGNRASGQTDIVVPHDRRK